MCYICISLHKKCKIYKKSIYYIHFFIFHYLIIIKKLKKIKDLSKFLFHIVSFSILKVANLKIKNNFYFIKYYFKIKFIEEVLNIKILFFIKSAKKCKFLKKENYFSNNVENT